MLSVYVYWFLHATNLQETAFEKKYVLNASFLFELVFPWLEIYRNFCSTFFIGEPLLQLFE